jgi:hypothetical protein
MMRRSLPMGRLGTSLILLTHGQAVRYGNLTPLCLEHRLAVEVVGFELQMMHVRSWDLIMKRVRKHL